MPTPKNSYFDVHQVLMYLKVIEDSINLDIIEHKRQIKTMIESSPITFVEPHFKMIEKLTTRLIEIKHIIDFINGNGYRLEDHDNV